MSKAQGSLGRFLTILLMLGMFGALSVTCTSGRASQTAPTPTTIQGLTSVTPTPQTTPLPTDMPPSSIASPTPTDGLSLGQVVLQHVRHLSEEIGPRPSATEKELEAALYIQQELRSYGYSVELQPFTILTLGTDEPLLHVVSPKEEALDARPLFPSGEGVVEAPLYHVGLGRTLDFPNEGLQGGIALIQRGLMLFQDKVSNAAEAGASAAIIYNDRAGNFGGTLALPGEVPVVSISQEEGLRLKALMDEGVVRVRVRVVREEHPSRNVVASGGKGGQEVVVFGGHYDTVPEGPGAVDNATGTGVLLALAERLAGRELPFDIRFVAFGSEETGLEGSRHYVDSLQPEEREELLAMVNFDAIGSGELNVIGDTELVRLALEAGEEQFRPVRASGERQGTSSDHASLRAAGVPVIFFAGSDLSFIHTPFDQVGLVDVALLEDSLQIALSVVDSVAAEASQ